MLTLHAHSLRSLVTAPPHCRLTAMHAGNAMHPTFASRVTL